MDHTTGFIVPSYSFKPPIKHREHARNHQEYGSAYGIRTRDLHLERVASWAARRMRPECAGEQGFEPRLADPESAVLPLDDSPIPNCGDYIILQVQGTTEQEQQTLYPHYVIACIHMKDNPSDPTGEITT